MTDPFDCPEFYGLCWDYREAVSPGRIKAAYERLQDYCRRVSAPKPMDFPEIDSSLIPLGFEPFNYTERN